MKRLVTGLCITAIFMTIGTACANRTEGVASIPPASITSPVPDAQSNTPITPTNPAPNLQSGAIINVDDLMKSPGSYIGPIKVEGVVSAISPGQQSLGLIDSREFADCGVTTCALFILPVQWSGPMPRVRDTVQVVGEVQKSNGKFVFVAQTLENTKQQTKNPK